MAVFSQTFLQADIPFNLGNGQFRKFTKDELREYVDNTRAMMFDGGLGVHIKSEHPPPGTAEGGPTPFDELAKQFSGPKAQQFADAIKTAGWVKDLHFDEATGAAKVLFEVKSKPYIQAIREERIKFSSPELREHYEDGLGREWGPTFAHFALTPKPRNPLQTVLKETSNGHQQYAMQFSMADAVGIEPENLPAIQFYHPGYRPDKSVSGDRRPDLGEHEDVRNEIGGEDKRPEFGEEEPRRHNLGVGESKTTTVGKDPASRSRYAKPRGNTRVDSVSRLRPQKHYESTEQGWQAREEPNHPTDKETEKVSNLGYHDSAAHDEGLPRMSKEHRPKYRRSGSKSTPGFGTRPNPSVSPNPARGLEAQKQQYSEQFDTSLMDQAPGYPGGQVPPIPIGPQDFDPNALGTSTNMLGGLPVENPDVIQLPDDAKRQKSEAAVQLLDQIGISLAVGTDLTKLDDSALDSLLAALKTKIKANQEAEEAEMADMQDQQLKEQVPMIGQMSEDEADAIIGHTLVEIAQFGPYNPRPPRQPPHPTPPKGENINPRPKPDTRPPPGRPQSPGGADYRGRHTKAKRREKIGRDREIKKNERKEQVRYSVPKPRKDRGVYQASEETQMSEAALTKRLANFKARHDKQARQGLHKLIATSKLPPGMKAQLKGDVPSVQFAESGPEVPLYTMQDIIEMFDGSCPNGMQFGDRALVDAMDEPNHPQGDRWANRGSEQISQAEAAQFAADGVSMSKAALEAYYDQKAKQPDWAKRLMPVANGNGRTH